MLKKLKSIAKIIILGIVITLSLSLIKSISKLANSNQKITDEEQHVANLKKENDILAKKLQSIKSIQFIESEARDKLGLAKKGETVIVLPDVATLKSLAPKLEEKQFSLKEPNWKLWLNLFL